MTFSDKPMKYKLDMTCHRNQAWCNKYIPTEFCWEGEVSCASDMTISFIFKKYKESFSYVLPVGI